MSLLKKVLVTSAALLGACTASTPALPTTVQTSAGNEFTMEEVVHATEQAIVQFNTAEDLEQQLNSLPYASNPFHILSRNPARNYSFQDGLAHIQQLAAAPLPFEGFYFYSNGEWINLTKKPQLRIMATGKFAQPLIFASSADFPPHELRIITTHYDKGVFIHYHPFKGMLAVAHSIAPLIYARLGTTPPYRIHNPQVAYLPSSKDLISQLAYAISAQKSLANYQFLVATDTTIVQYSYTEEYYNRFRSYALRDFAREIIPLMEPYDDALQAMKEDAKFTNMDLPSVVNHGNTILQEHHLGFIIKTFDVARVR